MTSRQITANFILDAYLLRYLVIEKKVIKEDRAIPLINLFGIHLTDNLFRLSSPPRSWILLRS